MTSYLPTNRNRPCPVCDKTNGNCRVMENNLVLCMTFTDAITAANHPEYRYTKPTKDRLWGIYAPRNDDAFDRERWLRERPARFEIREKEKAARAKAGLSLTERDRALRLLSSEMGLTDADRQRLRDRGLTDDQIKAGLFFSYRPGAKVSYRIPENLPGIRYGKLAGKHSGIACVAFNSSGQAIGYQVRLNEITDGGKYRWAYGQVSSHLPNHELPLNVARADNPKSQDIFLPEGILKPYVTACRLQVNCIGAAGGNHSGSPEQLRDAINDLLQENSRIVILSDAGAILNPNILKQYQNTISLLTSWGHSDRLCFGWWGQVTKDGPDCDEIDQNTFDQIKYLDPQTFFDIANREQWQKKVGEVQQKLTTLSHPPDILVNQKYFPSLEELNQIKPIPNKGILGLVGARGAGKSQTIEQIISLYRSLGYSVISLTPTIALGKNQATGWKIDWLGDLEADGIEKNFLARNTRELGLCYNSLKRLKERDYSQKHLIIIDEAEQGLSVPVTSSLLKENRPEILKIFGNLIRETFDNGGLILLSDADLSDSSINYISNLASEKLPVFIIKNEAKPKPWNVTLYTGGLTDHDDVSDLFTALEEGHSCRFCTDSKNRAKAIEREFLKRFPGEVCININGDTSQEAGIQEFVRDINKSILEHKPRLLIHTQSMGSGVSIDVPHFSRTFGSFCNEDPDQILQSLARDRGQENVTLWVKDSGNSDESLKSYFPNVIKKNILKDREQTADIIELAKTLATSSEDGEITPQALVNALQSMVNPQTGQWDSPHIDHYCNCKAKRNYAISQMGILLRQKLIEEGHNVKEYANGQANSVSDAISENLTEIKWEEAEAIANAEDIPIEVAKVLNKKQTLSKKEQEKISKAFLKSELPELKLTPQFIFDWVLKDRRKSLNAVTLFFFVQNPEIAKELDRKEYKHHLKGFIEHGVIHAPDIKTFSTRVKLIHDLKYFELIDLSSFEREYRATDEDVQAFMKRAYFMRYRLKSVFGLNITKKTDPIGFISDLGKKMFVGFLNRQYREGDKRVRAYRLDPAVLQNPERLEILKILAKKYDETLTGIDFPVSQENSRVINILQEFPVTESMAKIPPILDSTEPPSEMVSLPVNEQNEGIGYDWNEVIAGIDSEMGRLGWGVEDGQAYLMRVYGVRSRHLLKDEQVIEFWKYLKTQCLTAIAQSQQSNSSQEAS